MSTYYNSVFGMPISSVGMEKQAYSPVQLTQLFGKALARGPEAAANFGQRLAQRNAAASNVASKRLAAYNKAVADMQKAKTAYKQGQMDRDTYKNYVVAARNAGRRRIADPSAVQKMSQGQLKNINRQAPAMTQQQLQSINTAYGAPVAWEAQPSWFARNGLVLGGLIPMYGYVGYDSFFREPRKPMQQGMTQQEMEAALAKYLQNRSSW